MTRVASRPRDRRVTPARGQCAGFCILALFRIAGDSIQSGEKFIQVDAKLRV